MVYTCFIDRFETKELAYKEGYAILVFVCIHLSSCCAHILGSGCQHGGFGRHPDDCQRWYRCNWGTWIEMSSCGPGMVFSNGLKTCVLEGGNGDDCTHYEHTTCTTATSESCFQNPCQACRGGSLTLDLDGGDSPDTGNMPPGVTIIQAPTANSHDPQKCSKMALVKVNFERPNDNDCQPLLKVELELGEDRKERMFNFGDSSTNNGAGGDGGTQENDAEIDNYNATGVKIEASDKCNSEDLNVYPNAVGTGVYKVTFRIGNEYYRITNDAGLDDEKCDSCLFALSGQSDSEGTVNEEVYFAFNRVVGGTYRDGYGACKATISWHCSPSKSCFQNSCRPCRGGSLTLDLDGGASPDTGNMPPGVAIIQAPTPNSHDPQKCSKMALVKVNFEHPKDCHPLLKVELELEEDRKGRMFNFGDSSTNNGFGGDGGTQENDAEIDNYDATGVRIEASDKCNSEDLNVYPNAVGDGVTKVTFRIGNEYYRITNDAGLDDEKCHSCLFALSGQSDSEGSVNKEVYFAFNRVVSYPSPRDGHGACKATISWDCAPTSAPTSLLPCKGDYCVPVSVQYGSCFEIEEAATSDCRWKSSYDRRLDEKILDGTIIAYKIQWFDGSWTSWYSPHHGDIDHKLTDSADCPIPIYPNSLRRLWAYFYDHNHKYIICK